MHHHEKGKYSSKEAESYPFQEGTRMLMGEMAPHSFSWGSLFNLDGLGDSKRSTATEEKFLTCIEFQECKSTKS
ncbi:hypothetical protein Y1Q_0020636 [Alligator mississippiensis]|uniref:Uncharacterized protein n=1 Tax=Alligator mississippiensis TaxID=8496 RepID=A0A151NH68_ALLMI|nr:hypothetical protein Y1Q_0020636 [Alligator mississippiensis]